MKRGSGLKRSVADPLFSVEISVCQLYVFHIWRYHQIPCTFDDAKSTLWDNLWTCTFHKHCGLIVRRISVTCFSFILKGWDPKWLMICEQQKCCTSCRACAGLSNKCVFISLWIDRTKTNRVVSSITPILYHGWM